MKKTQHNILIELGIVGILVLLIIGVAIHANNSLARKDQAVKAQYSQVETVLQRRNDLLPNLTAAVSGSMKQEKEVFTAIANARKQYNDASTPADKFKADKELNRSTNVLLSVIHEKYPRLESNDHVNSLITEIEGSENRISVERQNYNAVVEDYNTSLTTFPTSLFAGRHKPAAYFKADKSAEKAPKVKLDN